MEDVSEPSQALLQLMQSPEGDIADGRRIAVAVSGGVDSMTLATFLHRTEGISATMFHAVSPAVPAAATRRVREYGAREGWVLRVIDGGEFDDASYRANPVNRCYFCKKNLYGAIAELTDDTIFSGTNLDDLDDFRPGLDAAKERRVRHPFVEARINKAGVRSIATALGLEDVAELPASPCLSSRIETGLAIVSDELAAVESAEIYLRSNVATPNLRCRRRADAIVVELDSGVLGTLTKAATDALSGRVSEIWRETAAVDLPVRFTAYRMGSAFLHAKSA